ncbi:MAG: Ig-like domain-containing protein [Muribaculum sp.]|uniref:Ig-like domain-containing protein n=1 Tax=Candidatus Merdivivens faecigallinarum TaxID=2840871 RepID=A0A9D9NQM9_9BACT|nr:Ig-like domain-containing protein [Candidatus Merdivivens faecigallinarum]
MKKFFLLTVMAVFMLAGCEPKNTDPIPVPVESVTLNEPEITLLVGEDFQLTAEVLPENADNKTIVWESSDTAIAAVDENGLVTAVAAGNAIVTATVDDKNATCKVIVNEPAPDGNIDMAGMSVEEVRAAIDEALAAGITEFRFTGTFEQLGMSVTGSPMDSSWIDNPFVGTAVEVVDFSGVTGWPEVDVDGLLNPDGQTATDGFIGIPAFAFSGLLDGVHTFPELREVILPSEVEAIGSQAFWNNPKLERVVAPDVKYVGNQCFVYSSAFNSIELPEATTVYTYAFRGTALTSISLPKVTEIYYGLFMDCPLTKLELTAAGDFTIHEHPMAAFDLGYVVFNFTTESCELVLNADKHYESGTASPKAASATNWFDTEWGSIAFN